MQSHVCGYTYQPVKLQQQFLIFSYSPQLKEITNNHCHMSYVYAKTPIAGSLKDKCLELFIFNIIANCFKFQWISFVEIS